MSEQTQVEWSPSWAYMPRQPFEYQVLELREGRWTGGFTTAKLQDALNAAGRDGWQCVGVVEVDKIRGSGKNREGLLLIMQRPVHRS